MGVSALLHLDPHSPEAQVFYEIAKALHKIGPASDPPSVPPTPGSDDRNNSGRTTRFFGKRWLGLEVAAHFLVIFFYIFTLV